MAFFEMPTKVDLDPGDWGIYTSCKICGIEVLCALSKAEEALCVGCHSQKSGAPGRPLRLELEFFMQGQDPQKDEDKAIDLATAQFISCFENGGFDAVRQEFRKAVNRSKNHAGLLPTIRLGDGAKIFVGTHVAPNGHKFVIAATSEALLKPVGTQCILYKPYLPREWVEDTSLMRSCTHWGNSFSEAIESIIGHSEWVRIFSDKEI